MNETIRLTSRGHDLVRRGMPLLQGEGLFSHPLTPDAGAWVRLVDGQNRTVGHGVVDGDKESFLRVAPSRDAWPKAAKALLEKALEKREGLVRDGATDVYRLLNAEGDGVPGVVLDRYGDYAVAWAITPGIKALCPAVYEAAMDLCSFKGIYEKGPPREGFHPGQGDQDEPVLGEAAPKVFSVRERGMVLEARLTEGPKTGIYPDQRENRTRLGALVKGKKVLNAFSYTGAFSVSAALNGALETVSVDLSKRALEVSEANFRLNKIDLSGHRHVRADCFDYLKLALKKGFRFDVAILDPPTFSTSRKGTFQARRDWPRLLAGVTPILNDQGLLAVSCNTRHLSESDMRNFLNRGDLGLSIESVFGLPPDFPVHPLLPQTDYLKFILARLH